MPVSLSQFKFIIIAVSFLLLAGCYETTREIIRQDQAVEVDLVKDLKFVGRGREEGGGFSSETTTYTIVGRKRPHDYVYVSDDPMAGERTIRFYKLEDGLFLAQIRPEESNRYQLLLIRKNGPYFDVLMPERFNDQNIDVFASQKDFANKLGLRFSGRGYGPYFLEGDPKNIRIFMHSLTTLPTEAVYRFSRTDSE